MITVPATIPARVPQRPLLLVALLLALASIASAWFFELVVGYAPCKLCLLQRWPYYIGLPLGLGAYMWRDRLPGIGRVLVFAFILTFAVSAMLGAYHAGVEWKIWPGPTDCSGRLTDGPASVADLRKSLQTTKVVRCDDASLRILGLSFAGWNVIVSAMVAGFAAMSLRREPR